MTLQTSNRLTRLERNGASSPTLHPRFTKQSLKFKLYETPRLTMSAPAQHNDSHDTDPVEAIVPLMPLVLPLAGGVLIFLLAFIAVFMS